MYTPNNIEFRIVSSGVIAQFKQDQAFDFNELINNTEFTFSSSSKEILLLNYEIWTKFIYSVERLFIRMDSIKKLSEDKRHSIISMVDDSYNDIWQIIDAHPEFFDKRMKDVIKETNSQCIISLKKHINDLGNDSIYTAYPKIVKKVSSILHDLLFQLQECEYLLNSQTHRNAFLSYDESTKCSDECDCTVVHRAETYKKFFNVSEFYIKNYTYNDIGNALLNEFENKHLDVKSVVDCS